MTTITLTPQSASYVSWRLEAHLGALLAAHRTSESKGSEHAIASYGAKQSPIVLGRAWLTEAYVGGVILAAGQTTRRGA